MMNSGEFDGLSSSEGFDKIVEQLSGRNLAHQQVNYKLRDWLISRQRYWGAPIPFIYCDKCGEVPVPEKDLPVLLPYVEKYQPTGTGESPLAAIPEFVHTKCPKCGGDAKRDTDTISQWVCSSWYFLRYASPHEDKAAFDEDKVKMWLPVDLYVGGVEHAILHLLYSRFITKVLYEAGCIDFKEPFSRLFNQGMICRVSEKSGKLEKMSKSKGNVVNPDILVNKFGTDSLRAYELFIGPPELDSEWDDSGIEGVYRWLRKVFVFVKTTNFSKGSEISREVKRYIHTAIQKITEDIERFHMNTIISTLMECFNNLQDYAKKNPERIYKESISEYILLMAPVVPHLAEELWNAMGNKGSVFKEKWPEFNPDFIRKDNAVIVIQVNGKVREKVELPTGSDQKKVEEVCFAAEKVKSAIEGKEIKKIIYVPDKILNIVVG
jgi:leucyl-tRNA synthetase